ncbi:hypothetical protein A2U01_0116811, partial [Trifolium medium]|nr:hypothetical protein [Trifolium medium]
MEGGGRDKAQELASAVDREGSPKARHVLWR